MAKWHVSIEGPGGLDKRVLPVEADSLLQAISVAVSYQTIGTPDMEVTRFIVTSPSGEVKILSAAGYADRLAEADTTFYKAANFGARAG